MDVIPLACFNRDISGIQEPIINTNDLHKYFYICTAHKRNLYKHRENMIAENSRKSHTF